MKSNEFINESTNDRIYLTFKGHSHGPQAAHGKYRVLSIEKTRKDSYTIGIKARGKETFIDVPSILPKTLELRFANRMPASVELAHKLINNI